MPELSQAAIEIATKAEETLDELTIARKMATGELSSPQVYRNVTLFDIRITGTGYAYRTAHDEFCYRNPDHYLTQDFLDRCNGLAVLWEHTDGPQLNSEEYQEKNIGSVMLPYIKGTEVWGIAKIYDDPAIKIMSENQLSTSPGVVLTSEPNKNKRAVLEDGTIILFEDKPALLDHIAVCEKGVWDKMGDAIGVNIGNIKEIETMPDNIKDAAEDEKKDACMEEKKDAAPAWASSIMDRLDAMNARMDSFEKKDAKKDSDEDKKDASEDEKKDASEEDDKKEDKKDKKDSKKDESEDKKDASEDEKKDTADEEKRLLSEVRREAEKAYKDAQTMREENAKMVARLAQLEKAMPKDLSDADYDELATIQSRHDAVAQAHGKRTPRAMAGETPFMYQVRLASEFKSHSPAWKGEDLKSLPESVLMNVAIPQIYKDADAASKLLSEANPMELRAVRQRDQAGRQITTFTGNPMAWMQDFCFPPRKATFANPKTI